MYMEVGEPDHGAHFHACCQDDVAVFSLDPVDLIAGLLPRRQRRLVEAWAELHQAELLADWRRLQEGVLLPGELFGPMRDLAVFNQVRLDPEVHALVARARQWALSLT